MERPRGSVLRQTFWMPSRNFSRSISEKAARSTHTQGRAQQQPTASARPKQQRGMHNAQRTTDIALALVDAAHLDAAGGVGLLLLLGLGLLRRQAAGSHITANSHVRQGRAVESDTCTAADPPSPHSRYRECACLHPPRCGCTQEPQPQPSTQKNRERAAEQANAKAWGNRGTTTGISGRPPPPASTT